MQKAVKFVFALVIIAVVISTAKYCSNPYSTETVVYYEYEKSISGEGFVLRNETIVSNEVGGVFEPLINDGERVSRMSKLGAVLRGEPDEKMISELNALNERIEDIEKSTITAEIYKTDTLRIINAVKSNIKGIRTAVQSGDYAKASALKKEIGYLKGRADKIENSDAREELLAGLYDQKAVLESKIGTGQTDIYAPIAGIYTSVIDGLEKYGSEEGLSALIPSEVEDFKKTMKDFARNPLELCKITDNFYWYLAAVITEEEAEDVSVGAKVSLVVDIADGAEVNGTIYSLSEAEDGKRVVVVKCDKFIDGITGVRSVDYKLVLQRKTGLRIPTEALRIENGRKGVYILLDKKKSFRFVNNDPFRTEDDKYYIVDRKYAPQGSDTNYVPLKEYDKVLLAPEDVR